MEPGGAACSVGRDYSHQLRLVFGFPFKGKSTLTSSLKAPSLSPSFVRIVKNKLSNVRF